MLSDNEDNSDYLIMNMKTEHLKGIFYLEFKRSSLFIISCKILSTVIKKYMLTYNTRMILANYVFRITDMKKNIA